MTKGIRTSTNLPNHIKKHANALPPGVYFNALGNGRWCYQYKDNATGQRKTVKLCGPQASITQIWQAYEANQTSTKTTFKTLSNEFQTTIHWQKLAPSTKADYTDCHRQICATKTSAGEFGDIGADQITIGTIRKYRDKRAEQSESRANKELSYLSRVFSWAFEYEKITTNPTRGVKKISIKPRQHYATDKDYNFLLSVAKQCGSWYMPYAMEIAYLCRMRLSEVIDLNDADELEAGLLIRRRKGSRNNIVTWETRLKTAWTEAKAKRDSILKQHKMPTPLKPEFRRLFISERTGDKITASTLKTAKARLDKQAQELAAQHGIEYNHFTFHDLKRKGISDTEGDKLKASGHRSASMLNVYDVSIETVNPAGKK